VFRTARRAHFLTVPTISESLAGRAGFIEVWPFTQGEVSGKPDRFIDLALTGPAPFASYQPARFSRRDLLERACTGATRKCTGSPPGSGPAGFGTTC
jgi:predicted AAA+ superfamily ATPase